MTALLLSGGIDSAVIAVTQHPKHCIFFEYGQNQRQQEKESAREIARSIGARFHVHDMHIHKPALRDDVVFDVRNAAFASFGAMIAAQFGCESIAIGCNASDWQRFPDCRPEFWGAMRKVFSAGGYGVSISTPLLYKTKAQVVEMARAAHLDLADTWSCYNPAGREPCGVCLACKTRTEAMEKAA